MDNNDKKSVLKKSSIKKQLKNDKNKNIQNIKKKKPTAKNNLAAKNNSAAKNNIDSEVDINFNDSEELEEKFVNDYREIKNKYDINNNKSQKVLTDYELAVLIGNRATQLALNAPPLIDNIEGMDHIQIAEEELRQKKSPFLFCRTIGNKEEYYKLDDIIVDEF